MLKYFCVDTEVVDMLRLYLGQHKLLHEMESELQAPSKIPGVVGILRYFGVDNW